MNAIIAYIPVIHRGLVDFLNKYPKHQVFLLGSDILSQLVSVDPTLVSIKREPRAIDDNYAVVLTKTIRCNNNVGFLRLSDIDSLAEFDAIVLPYEDITRTFAKHFLVAFRNKIIWDQTFVRWDMSKTLSVVPPTCDRTIDLVEAERMGLETIIDLAFEKSKTSSDWWRQVGAVMVREREVLFSDRNRHLPHEYRPYMVGDPRSNFDAGQRIELSTAIHAEQAIISKAARNGVKTEGADLLVTTFPCRVCANLIGEAGFRRLFFLDGYSQLDAVDILRDKGVEIIHIKKD